MTFRKNEINTSFGNNVVTYNSIRSFPDFMKNHWTDFNEFLMEATKWMDR